MRSRECQSNNNIPSGRNCDVVGVDSTVVENPTIEVENSTVEDENDYENWRN